LRATLREANLFQANLREANLWEADLTEADLREANLREADLREADLIEADLSGGVDLRRADLSGARLKMANLTEANLSRARLNGADLSWADLTRADLSNAQLTGADLREADLIGVRLGGANLSEADLSGACLKETDLREAILREADLRKTNLRGADLTGARLTRASLVETNLTGADLTGCRVYGISAWDQKLEGAKQRDLIITPENIPTITVDDIEVTQFIYLLLHNEKIRDVIDTITSKAVLILGRFTDERKAVLDKLREELRSRNLLPILFDFAIPARRDVTETIKTLASLARFVIADVTDATEVRVELHNIIPDFTSLPIQLILLRGHPEFVSLSHLTKFPWVLPVFEYDDQKHLLASLDKSIISPAEDTARKLTHSSGETPDGQR
jgi:uncharacterized protein YjbI with pentapeptide repeats